MNNEQRKRLKRLVALSAAGALCTACPHTTERETPSNDYARPGAYAWPRKGGEA